MFAGRRQGVELGRRVRPDPFLGSILTGDVFEPEETKATRDQIAVAVPVDVRGTHHERVADYGADDPLFLERNLPGRGQTDRANCGQAYEDKRHPFHRFPPWSGIV
jgi:hypothetical protein